MKLFQLIKLGHADFVAQRKLVIISALAAGIPLMILLALNFITTGLENVLNREASLVTDDTIILAVQTEASVPEITKRIEQFDGEVLAELTLAESANFPTISDYMTTAASIKPRPMSSILEQPQLDHADSNGFHFLDFWLNSISSRAPAEIYQSILERFDNNAEILLLASFPTIERADQAYHRLSSTTTNISEPFSNQISIYNTFKRTTIITRFFRIASFLVMAVIIIATYVYLLDHNFHSMIIYRTLGASTRDLLVISLTFLLEVGICIILVAMLGGILLALLVSGLNADYLHSYLTNLYGVEPSSTLLLGYGLDALYIKLIILITAPLSLFLMIDQFSVNHLMNKLKSDQNMLQ